MEKKERGNLVGQFRIQNVFAKKRINQRMDSVDAGIKRKNILKRNCSSKRGFGDVRGSNILQFFGML